MGNKSKLALLGGEPVIPYELNPYPSIGGKEIERVTKVLKSGVLSGFYGSWCDEFWGGDVVKVFEKAWSDRFNIEHSISMNSATSCLVAAMGAVGIGPGDEVIVPPYTMSATVVAPLAYGGIPVFADIDADTFCLDPNDVLKKITPKTRAIITVNLFGHPSPLDELRELARVNDLYLIEDNAQGPLAEYKNQYAGTLSDIGIFSLNYHKHIHTGEGGVCVTDDDDLALRLKLIRNHGENVTEDLGITNLANLFCFNFRLTEMSAAVGLSQLENAKEHVNRRIKIGTELTRKIKGLNGLTPPFVSLDAKHVYYMWALKYDEKKTGVSRDVFSKALVKEGFPNEQGYVKPFYLLPLFQQKIAMGSQGFPFNLNKDIDYSKGICPVAERMHEKELILFQPCSYGLDDKEINLLAETIHKVYNNLSELKNYTDNKE